MKISDPLCSRRPRIRYLYRHSKQTVCADTEFLWCIRKQIRVHGVDRHTSGAGCRRLQRCLCISTARRLGVPPPLPPSYHFVLESKAPVASDIKCSTTHSIYRSHVRYDLLGLACLKQYTARTTLCVVSARDG